MTGDKNNSRSCKLMELAMRCSKILVKTTFASEALCTLADCIVEFPNVDLDVSAIPCTRTATSDEAQSIDGRIVLNMLSLKTNKNKTII